MKRWQCQTYNLHFAFSSFSSSLHSVVQVCKLCSEWFSWIILCISASQGVWFESWVFSSSLHNRSTLAQTVARSHLWSLKFNIEVSRESETHQSVKFNIEESWKCETHHRPIGDAFSLKYPEKHIIRPNSRLKNNKKVNISSGHHMRWILTILATLYWKLSLKWHPSHLHWKLSLKWDPEELFSWRKHFWFSLRKNWRICPSWELTEARQGQEGWAGVEERTSSADFFPILVPH